MKYTEYAGCFRIFVSLILTGCLHTNHTPKMASLEDSRLAVTVPEPERLREVNSIAVALPRVNEGAKSPVISPSDAQNTIVGTMREMLSIKISEYPHSSVEDPRNRLSTTSDCILSTDLIRIEKSSSQLGGDPAIVSFRMTATMVKTNQLVWSGQFYYRQPTMSENVLSLGTSGGSGAGKSLMRFKGAQEVFLEGVRLAIADFSARREKQFFK
jgi:hypothetical protein